MSILKKKLLVATITTINAGFLYVLFNNQGMETNIIPFLSDLLIFTLLVSITYVAPIVFILGIPISIGIDKLTSFVKNSKVRILIRFPLYPIAGLSITLIFSLISGSSPIFSNVHDIVNFVLASIYPSIFFWLIDSIIK